MQFSHMRRDLWGMRELERFMEAQGRDYPASLAEIYCGFKTNHWIRYVFSQLRGPGMSFMSEFYGIVGLEEAKKGTRRAASRPACTRWRTGALSCPSPRRAP